MSQIAFPLTHAGLGINLFCFTTETLFVKKTPSTVYTAAAITQDVVPTIDGVSIDVRQMGSHQVYGIQNAGMNYGFTIPVHPQNIGFLSYGCNPPNYTTPAGTSARSLKFLIKYKQAQETAGITRSISVLFSSDMFLLFLDIEILVFSLNTICIEINENKMLTNAKSVNLKRVLLDLICVFFFTLLKFFQILP
jgi:hypothetical protein